jgi:hypothetical protein
VTPPVAVYVLPPVPTSETPPLPETPPLAVLVVPPATFAPPVLPPLPPPAAEVAAAVPPVAAPAAPQLPLAPTFFVVLVALFVPPHARNTRAKAQTIVRFMAYLLSSPLEKPQPARLRLRV